MATTSQCMNSCFVCIFQACIAGFSSLTSHQQILTTFPNSSLRFDRSAIFDFISSYPVRDQPFSYNNVQTIPIRVLDSTPKHSDSRVRAQGPWICPSSSRTRAGRYHHDLRRLQRPLDVPRSPLQRVTYGGTIDGDIQPFCKMDDNCSNRLQRFEVELTSGRPS